MSEQRLDSLDRAVSRLLQAQREALEACEGVLDDREILDDADEFFDAPTPLVEEGQLYRAALEQVRTILASASEDVQTILGEVDESSHRGLAALPATVEEHSIGRGPEELLLPGIGLQAERPGEGYPVEG